MRSVSPHGSPDLARFLTDGTIILDTSALLALYRLDVTARDETLGALDKVAERLWMPHQVAVEFYRNLAEVRDELPKAYDTLQKAIADLTRQARKVGEGRRFGPSGDQVTDVVSKAVTGLRDEIEKLRDADPLVVHPGHDAILERLENLFDGRLGERPPSSTTRARVEEFGSYRAPNQIPPGYKDIGKGSDLRGLATTSSGLRSSRWWQPTTVRGRCS